MRATHSGFVKNIQQIQLLVCEIECWLLLTVSFMQGGNKKQREKSNILCVLKGGNPRSTTECISQAIKSPQTWWLQSTNTYSLIVLETRSPESRCVQGCVSPLPTPLQSLQGRVLPYIFQLLVTLGIYLLLAAELSSLPLSSHALLLLFSVSSFLLSLKRALVIGFRGHPNNPR